ncbi:stress-responsive transcriptional regulator PspC [Irregularibacter muris]|uniref:Stress-responsive transcriptional regulator PspC n=1 Tax=Irregularibacter muris TaxID=1796619 RepID=A0AAE3HIA5_9FIRM|nr:stress-responsive transcriptional regulator PspC [Irregularibacter muris]MCR1900037.1 stress-responsive transcriptional regulator PspC [Irregularibacter muris]
MNKKLYTAAGLISGILMILGLFYIKEKKEEKDFGGQLVRVNYRYSKSFEE